MKKGEGKILYQRLPEHLCMHLQLLLVYVTLPLLLNDFPPSIQKKKKKKKEKRIKSCNGSEQKILV